MSEQEISMTTLKERREHYLFTEAQISRMKKAAWWRKELIEEQIHEIMDVAYVVSPYHYLSQDQLAFILDISAEKVVDTWPKVKNLRLSEKKIYVNMRGVGYKIAASEEEATVEAGKAMKRSLADADYCGRILEQTIYEFDKLREKNPKFHMIYMNVKGAYNHVKHILMAYRENLEDQLEEVRLLDQQISDEVKKPRFIT